MLNDILKHVDLPKSEKEKVNIALLSYAAGFVDFKIHCQAKFLNNFDYCERFLFFSFATAKDPEGTQTQGGKNLKFECTQGVLNRF